MDVTGRSADKGTGPNGRQFVGFGASTTSRDVTDIGVYSASAEPLARDADDFQGAVRSGLVRACWLSGWGIASRSV